MTDQTYPEILRSDITNTILTMLKIGITNLTTFDFLDPPAPETMMYSLNLLHSMGCMDMEEQNGKLTLSEIGRMMSEFPLHPKLSKCILGSNKLSCS